MKYHTYTCECGKAITFEPERHHYKETAKAWGIAIAFLVLLSLAGWGGTPPHP